MPFEPRHTWLIFLSMIAFAGAACAAPPPDTLAQRLVACAACHGREGRATNDGYYPRIAGKPAGYLFNQLVNFRDGRRRNAAMTYLVNHQTDAYLREIAGHFAALDLPYPPPLLAKADPAVLARGERLVRQGDTARGIPACVACHGAELTGVEPAIPGLLGLPRDYMNAQFGAWKGGLRQAASPDCMGDIARKLTSEDIGAAGAWLASRPWPAAAAAAAAKPAAAADALKLPLRCGSAGVP